jgi:hypothetical protein
MCVKDIVHLVGIKNVSEISGYWHVFGRVEYNKFIILSSIMDHNVLRLGSYCKGSCGSYITYSWFTNKYLLGKGVRRVVKKTGCSL